MTATTTTHEPILKRLHGDKIATPLYKRSKLALLMRKDTSFGGEGRYVNVKTSGTAGGSADFAQAQANQEATAHKRFFVTHRQQYSLFTVSGALIERTKAGGDKAAMVRALQDETESALYTFGRDMAARLWGNAGGARGRIAATTTLASPTLVLTNPADVRGFEVGRWIQLAPDDGSAASPSGLRDSGAKLQIVGINRAAGTLTLSANISTISGAALGDYVFIAGDYANAMTGMRGWAPTSDPTPTENFFGVDRTSGDLQRLSGYRHAGNGNPKEQTMIDAMAIGQELGIEISTWFVSPRDYADFVSEVGSKKEVRAEDKKYGVSFSAVEINGPDGTVRVVSEPDCPQGYAWGLNPEKEIWLRTAGECPMELKNDHGKLLQRLSNSDAYEGRLGAYGNIFHENPGHSIIVTW